MALPIILLSGFLLRLLTLPFGTHSVDMNTWRFWSAQISSLGFASFFDKVWSDYLPLHFYILYFIGKIKSSLLFLPEEYLFKLPSILSDILVAFLIYKLVLKISSKKWALTASALYFLNPAVFFNSSMWGQVDGIGNLLIFASFFFLIEKKLILSAIVAGLSFTFKPIYLFTLPLFLIYLLKQRDLKRIFSFICINIVTVWFVALPFIKNGASIVTEPFMILFNQYQRSIIQYPYSSLNAYNFWHLIEGWWESDLQLFLGIQLKVWSFVIFSSLTLLILYYLCMKLSKKISLNNNIYLLTFCFFALFLFLYTFATRAHERHLLSVFPFLASLIVYGKRFIILYVTLSLIYILNLYSALVWLNNKNIYPYPNFINSALSFIVVIVSLYTIYILVRDLRKNHNVN